MLVTQPIGAQPQHLYSHQAPGPPCCGQTGRRHCLPLQQPQLQLASGQRPLRVPLPPPPSAAVCVAWRPPCPPCRPGERRQWVTDDVQNNGSSNWGEPDGWRKAFAGRRHHPTRPSRPEPPCLPHEASAAPPTHHVGGFCHQLLHSHLRWQLGPAGRQVAGDSLCSDREPHRLLAVLSIPPSPPAMQSARQVPDTHSSSATRRDSCFARRMNGRSWYSCGDG